MISSAGFQNSRGASSAGPSSGASSASPGARNEELRFTERFKSLEAGDRKDRPYGPRPPLKYIKEKDGAIIDFALKDPKYKEIEEQIRTAISETVEFMENHTSVAERPWLTQGLQEKITRFSVLLDQGPGKGSLASTKIELLFGYAKDALDGIRTLMHDESIPLDTRKAHVGRVPDALAQCVSGIAGDINEIFTDLLHSGPGLANTTRLFHLDMVNRVTESFADYLFSHETNYEGNQKHYFRGVRNLVAKDYAVPIVEDQDIDPALNKSFYQNMIKEHFAKQLGDPKCIASKMLDELTSSFVRDAEEACRQGQTPAEIQKMLQVRFGNVGFENFMDPDDPMKFQSNLSVIFSTLAYNHVEAGVLQPFRTRSIAGGKQFGRRINSVAGILHKEAWFRQDRRGELHEPTAQDLAEEHNSALVSIRTELTADDLDEAWVREGNSEEIVFPAITFARPALLRHVLAKGIDANAIHPGANCSALTAAVEYRSPEAVDLLLKYGAHADGHPGEWSDTPLARAARRGLREIASRLMETADVNRQNTVQATPLHLALRAGHVGVAEDLLKAGADVDRPMEISLTPLMVAASLCDAQAVRMLLDRGADAGRRCEDGRTASDLAKEPDRQEKLRLIRRAADRISAG